MNDVLFWSKKTKGQGFFNEASETKQEVVYNAIRQAIQGESGKDEAYILPVSVPTQGSVNTGYVLMNEQENKPPATKCELCCTFCTTVGTVPAIIGA